MKYVVRNAEMNAWLHIDMTELSPAIILFAVAKANKSTMRHRMSAVVFHGKNIIGSGFNKCHRSGKKSNHHSVYCYSEHAEVSALINTPRSELRGASMFIYRRNNRCSAPCPTCRSIVERVGIKYIYYIDNNSNIVMERV